MKNLNTQLTVLLLACSVLSFGCAKSGGDSDSSNVVVPTDSVVAPAGLTGTTTSNGIVFTPVSLAEMNSYVGSHPLNAPTNYAMTVNLSDTGNGTYGGNVTLSYDDNGQHFAGSFNTCLYSDCKNKKFDSYGTSKDNGANEAGSNYWFTLGGKKVFSGYFQDNWGAIVIVIDNVVNQGDGQGGGLVSGQVWYRNFAQSFANVSPYRQCWFLYAGPNDCRSGIVSSKKKSDGTPWLYPQDSYRKLGSFTGLMKSTAFQ